MDKIQEAFSKVKQDIFHLGEEISSLKSDIIELKSEIKMISSFLDDFQVKNFQFQHSNTQTNQQTDTSTPQIQQIPTHKTNM